MTEADLERFVRAFIRKEKRERWLTLLGSEKGRKKLRDTFNHYYDLDERWAESLDVDATAESLLKRLKREGAGSTCDLLSADSDLDGVTINLDEALRRVVESGCGTYIVCILDRLALFEPEDRGVRFLLRRPYPVARTN